MGAIWAGLEKVCASPGAPVRDGRSPWAFSAAPRNLGVKFFSFQGPLIATAFTNGYH